MTTSPDHPTPGSRRVPTRFRRIGVLTLATVVLAGWALSLAPTPADAISSKPSSVSLGKTPINRTVIKTVKVTIADGYEFTTLYGSGTTGQFWATTDCFGRVGPATCTVNQHFTPRTVGQHNAVTSVRECRSNIVVLICRSLHIDVSGTAYSIAGAKPSTINFGNRALFSNKTVTSTLKVDYGYTMSVSVPSGTATTGSWFTSTNCGGVRGPNTCKVNSKFTPRSVGSHAAYARLWQCPDAGGTCAPIDVSVSGQAYSAFSVKPTSVDFGTVKVGKNKTKSVTVKIDGGHGYHKAELPSGTSTFAVDDSACRNKIGPINCKVKVSFTPPIKAAYSSGITVWQCPNAGGVCPAIVAPVHGRTP